MTRGSSPLTRGQNTVWPHRHVTITCGTSADVDVSLLLLDGSEKVRSSDDFVFYKAPIGPGVRLRGTTLDVSLDEIPRTIETLRCLASVDPAKPPLADACPLLITVDALDAGASVSFPLGNLSTERAVVTVDVYRRGEQWKVRAVGQGWDDGLPRAISLHGVEMDDETPTEPLTPGQDAEERALQHVHGILGDLTSSAAARESARDYAAWRLAADLERIAEQPSLRGPSGDEQRSHSRRSHDEIVGRAEAQHRTDLETLQAELSLLEDMLPAPLASYQSKTWREPVGPGSYPPRVIRLGSLALAGQSVGAPMLSAFPGRALLWLEPTHSSTSTTAFLHGLIHRVLTCSPIGSVRVDVVDLAGQVTENLRNRLDPRHLETGERGSPLIDFATTVPLATTTLNRLAKRVDLAQMAVESGVADALDEVTSPVTLLVWCGFPLGLGAAQLEDLRRISEVGALAGVQAVLTTEVGPETPPDDREASNPDPIHDVTNNCLWLDGAGRIPLSDTNRTSWTFRPECL